jgi:CubicO group peptidase (beta-lactamase class C family)
MRRLVTIGMAASWLLAVFLARGQAPPSAPAPAPAPVAPAAPAAPAGPAPHLKFEQTVLNLGDIVRGQDAIAEFVYTNSGDAPLKILAAKPG